MTKQPYMVSALVLILLLFPACFDSCNKTGPDEILEYSSIIGTYQRDPADITDNSWDRVEYVYEIFDPEKKEQYPQADWVTI